ncbi:MAG: hypothetical protein EXX96DRAFT_646218 [Benjaminiella poitrasii]|nr:MAG: hypothetical protein EXX96DRAFT_646218 [Benjaminiella poitrasii]
MILGGDGSKELISRFTLSTLENQYPFILSRKQFPAKPSFTISINKSQGHSLKIVDISLQSTCIFAWSVVRGYVPLSHCQNKELYESKAHLVDMSSIDYPTRVTPARVLECGMTTKDYF